MPVATLHSNISILRHIQGKFTLKNDDYRKVRTLRLTDATWKVLGITAEFLRMTRADLLENFVRQHNLTFPVTPVLKQPSLNNPQVEQLTVLAEQVLVGLRLGKQAASYKSAQKALRQLI